MAEFHEIALAVMQGGHIARVIVATVPIAEASLVVLAQKVVDRYVAENEVALAERGFEWSDIGEIPARYWDAAGARMARVMRFEEIPDARVLEAAEKPIPTAPPESMPKRRRGK